LAVADWQDHATIVWGRGTAEYQFVLVRAVRQSAGCHQRIQNRLTTNEWIRTGRVNFADDVEDFAFVADDSYRNGTGFAVVIDAFWLATLFSSLG
jgi:hypothetical protein